MERKAIVKVVLVCLLIVSFVLPIQVSADSVEGSDLDHNALFSGKVTVIRELRMRKL